MSSEDLPVDFSHHDFNIVLPKHQKIIRKPSNYGKFNLSLIKTTTLPPKFDQNHSECDTSVNSFSSPRISIQYNNHDEEIYSVEKPVLEVNPTLEVESPFVHRKMRLSPHKAKTTDK